MLPPKYDAFSIAVPQAGHGVPRVFRLRTVV
jgi:hypothetical protein